MKDIKQIYQALLDGRKLRNIGWGGQEYFHLKDGLLLDEKGEQEMAFFNVPQYWEIYEEPKPEEKWYVVTYKSKVDCAPYTLGSLYKSKEDFLECNGGESDFDWIDLKEYKRGEA